MVLSLFGNCLNYAVVRSGVFWENSLGMLSAHSGVDCSLMVYILASSTSSIGVMADIAWVLGTGIFHKNKTKEKLKFPKVACCHSCFFRSFMVVNFFFLLLLLFPISAFVCEEESDAAQEISFGSLCFSPYKQENCSHQTSQIILRWQKVCDTYTKTGIRKQSGRDAVSTLTRHWCYLMGSSSQTYWESIYFTSTSCIRS